MNVLLPENQPFDINQPTNKLIDSKICVFDYSDKEEMDFFFKKITTYIQYRYPTVELMIGKHYNVELPLNWRILVTNTHDYICQLISIEELLHFDHQTPIFNPFYVGIPKILDVKVIGINQNPVEHFVPKLPKKNLLVMPIGTKNEWRNKITGRDGTETNYPDCMYVCDDLDTSKCEIGLYEDIIV